MRRLLRLYRHLALFTFKRDLEYRTSFISGFIANFVWSNFSLIFILVLNQVVGEFGGWQKYQMILLTGLWMLVNALGHGFIYGGVKRLVQDIHFGRLDILLALPVDSLFIATLRRPLLPSLTGVVEGAMVVIYALSKLHFGGIIGLFQFGVLLLVAIIIYWSLWTITATISIHFTNTDNLFHTVPELVDLARFPQTAYPSPLMYLFSSLIPVLLMTTLPAEALQGVLSWDRFFYCIVIGVALMLFTRWFWQWSLKSYASASS